mmetsp:Transcript_2394/g.6900  ORF Transcript_2394/g.6900 Transcript_2394/m.6900 type:complete len:214 (+) Transcript_2394:31-672(+)
MVATPAMVALFVPLVVQPNTVVVQRSPVAPAEVLSSASAAPASVAPVFPSGRIDSPAVSKAELPAARLASALRSSQQALRQQQETAATALRQQQEAATTALREQQQTAGAALAASRIELEKSLKEAPPALERSIREEVAPAVERSLKDAAPALERGLRQDVAPLFSRAAAELPPAIGQAVSEASPQVAKGLAAAGGTLWTSAQPAAAAWRRRR